MINLDTSDFLKGLIVYEKDVKTEYNLWIKTESTYLLSQIKKRTPYISGTLRDGWELEFQQIQGFLEATIINDISYAYYVEYGTEHFDGRFMMNLALAEIERRMEK